MSPPCRLASVEAESQSTSVPLRSSPEVTMAASPSRILDCHRSNPDAGLCGCRRRARRSGDRLAIGHLRSHCGCSWSRTRASAQRCSPSHEPSPSKSVAWRRGPLRLWLRPRHAASRSCPRSSDTADYASIRARSNLIQAGAEGPFSATTSAAAATMRPAPGGLAPSRAALHALIVLDLTVQFFRT